MLTDKDDHSTKKKLPNKQTHTEPELSALVYIATGCIETFSSENSMFTGRRDGQLQ